MTLVQPFKGATSVGRMAATVVMNPGMKGEGLLNHVHSGQCQSLACCSVRAIAHMVPAATALQTLSTIPVEGFLIPAYCLQVTPDQSIALVEYIAHLSVEDWDMIPYDLAQLGFLPPGEVASCSLAFVHSTKP